MSNQIKTTTLTMLSIVFHFSIRSKIHCRTGSLRNGAEIG